MAVTAEATTSWGTGTQEITERLDVVRRRAIDDYDVVGTPSEPNLQGLVELAARLCDVPTAVINIIDDRFQHQIASVGFSPDVCSREDSMCAKVIESPGTVVVPDARLDARFVTNPFVTRPWAAPASGCSCPREARTARSRYPLRGRAVRPLCFPRNDSRPGTRARTWVEIPISGWPT